MEHKNLWGFTGNVPDDADFTVALGEAAILRPGTDLTVLSWSAMVHTCVEAAAALAQQNIEVELIDLRTLWPWDRDRVLASVEKTGRLLIVHEAVTVGGFGAEIAACIAEQAFHRLKGPVRRLGAPRAPIPYSPALEQNLKITAAQISRTAQEMMI
jgi:pyruvate dehydrogenase E1 component beta subunit